MVQNKIVYEFCSSKGVTKDRSSILKKITKKVRFSIILDYK